MKRGEYPREILIKTLLEDAIPTLAYLLKRNCIEKIQISSMDEICGNSNYFLIKKDGSIFLIEEEEYYVDAYQYGNMANQGRYGKRTIEKKLEGDVFVNYPRQKTTSELVKLSQTIKDKINKKLLLEKRV
jgi:ABC-type microcin C transport system permease subunit YejE